MTLPPRTPALLAVLTLVNLGLFGAAILRGPAASAAPAPDGVLRGRGLEIVDARGKVRASLSIFPASRQPDGSTYPETVLLRLITAEGRPVVKIESAEDGAAMALSAAQGPAFVQVLARGGDPKVIVKDRQDRVVSTLP